MTYLLLLTITCFWLTNQSLAADGLWKNSGGGGDKWKVSGSVGQTADLTYWSTQRFVPVEIEYDYHFEVNGKPVRRPKFIDSVIFESVLFKRHVDLRDALFVEHATFESCDFWNQNDLGFSKFNQGVSFSSSNFEEFALFNDFESGADADFTFCKFQYTNFASAKIRGRTSFQYGEMHGRANFTGAKFGATADFTGVRFGDLTSFNWASFSDTLLFRKCRFDGGLSFAGVRLPKFLDMRDVSFSEVVDLRSCDPPGSSGRCQIAVLGGDWGKLKLNMRVFELWFPLDTAQFRQVMPMEDQMSSFPSEEQKRSLYVQLLEKMRSDGSLKSAEALDRDYRAFEVMNGNWWNWFSYWTQRLWWDFGYSKGRVFAISILSWFIASLLNMLFIDRLESYVYSIPFLEPGNLLSHRNKTVRRMARHLPVFVYTAVVFFGLKLNLDNFHRGAIRTEPILTAWFFSLYIFGLICLGFIANIVFTSG